MRPLLAALVSIGASLSSAAQPALHAEDATSTLRIDGPITRWDEGLPIGNGLIGALVWGEGRTIRISLDRADLWDTRLPEIFNSPDWTYASMIALKEAKNHARHQELFDAPYDTIPYPTKLPAGRVEITLGEGDSIKSFQLTPGSNFVMVRVASSEGGEFAVGVFAATMEPVIVVENCPRERIRVIRPDGFKKLGYADAVTGSDELESWYTQTTLPTGAVAVLARTPVFLGEDLGAATIFPDHASLRIAIKTGATPEIALAAAREISRDLTQEEWLLSKSTIPRGHLPNPWRAFQSSRVSFPDPALQLHYDLCKHYYIAGSAKDQPPMPLQGVWTADAGGLPPWKGDYHNDLNTQMTYLAYHAAGLVDQGLSWINFNWDLMPEYRAFARSFYALPPRDDRYADPRHEPALIPGVMTIKGQPMGGWGQYSLSPTHSAWIAQSFYLHWKYTDDAAFLRDRAYPFCAAIGNGLLGLMTKDAAGHLKLPLSTSPEIHDNSYAAWLVPNSNYDLSLMRWLFAALKEMAETENQPESAARWAAALASLEPLHIDAATGLMFDAREKYEQSHRHFSHAMAIHPLGTLSIEGSAADRAVIDATLDQMKAMGTDWWTGYSFSWAACMFARTGRSEEALDYLTKYLSFTGPNGFHLNGDQSGSGLSKFTYRPFTLEGNFLAMEAIHQMLLQSQGTVGVPNSEIVRVFPAVSETWPDVSFDGLRAEGGWIVSATRKRGLTTRVQVLRPAGSGDRATTAEEMNPNAPARTLRLRDPFPGRAAHWSREVQRIPAGAGAPDKIVVDLRPGEFLIGEAQ